LEGELEAELEAELRAALDEILGGAQEEGPSGPAQEEGPSGPAQEEGPSGAAQEEGPPGAAQEEGPSGGAQEEGPSGGAQEEGPSGATQEEDPLDAALRKALEAMLLEDSSEEEGGPDGEAPEEEGGPDSGPPDSEAPDSGPPDSGPSDSEPPDSEAPDGEARDGEAPEEEGRPDGGEGPGGTPPRGPGPPFTPVKMFTCTYEVRLENLEMALSLFTERLEPSGPVKAINSNYGHKAQPGFERFLKRPKAAKPPPRRRRVPGARAPDGKLAPTTTRPRKPQGDGSCFNSALEATIIVGRADGPPPAVAAMLAENPCKYYAVKSFPTTGKTQVPGVLCPDLADGPFVANLWARFLTAEGVGREPGAPITVAEERPILVNFKFHLLRSSDRVLLKLARIVAHLKEAKAAAERAAAGPPAEEGGAGGRARALLLPYGIREIKGPQDSQNLSFKFVCPDRGGGLTKKVRVNIFFRGKVNVLGAYDFETPRRIHAFLCDLFDENWPHFVGQKPLPDRARRAAASAGGGRPPSGREKGALPGGRPPSEDPRLEEVDGEDVEGHQEDALHGRAVGGGGPPPDGPPEARDDVVDEDVRHDEQEEREERE
jgi:hypothetical protein